MKLTALTLLDSAPQDCVRDAKSDLANLLRFTDHSMSAPEVDVRLGNEGHLIGNVRAFITHSDSVRLRLCVSLDGGMSIAIGEVQVWGQEQWERVKVKTIELDSDATTDDAREAIEDLIRAMSCEGTARTHCELSQVAAQPA